MMHMLMRLRLRVRIHGVRHVLYLMADVLLRWLWLMMRVFLRVMRLRCVAQMVLTRVRCELRRVMGSVLLESRMLWMVRIRRRLHVMHRRRIVRLLVLRRMRAACVVRLHRHRRVVRLMNWHGHRVMLLWMRIIRLLRLHASMRHLCACRRIDHRTCSCATLHSEWQCDGRRRDILVCVLLVMIICCTII